MDFATWLQNRLKRYPLHGGGDVDRTRYTKQVMARIRALHDPRPVPRPRLSWLPWTLALSTAAVALLMLVQVPLDQRSQRSEPVVLAEDPAREDAWVGQTLQLLETLDEDVSDDSSPDSNSDNDWMEDLQLLEESQPTTSS